MKRKLGFAAKQARRRDGNDALENQNGIYNEGTTTGVGYLTIDAQRIKEVYGNCSEAGKEWPGDHK